MLDFDDLLLEQLKRKNGSQVHVQKIVCRLSVQKIIHLFNHPMKKVNIFIYPTRKLLNVHVII